MITSARMYLALTLIAAFMAVTAAVRSPLHRRGAAVWFALGFPAFHFPGTLLSIGALVTLIAGLQGVFQSRVGLLSLLPAAIGAYALCVVKVRSHASGKAFERALEQTLGPDFRGNASQQVEDRISRNPFRLRRPGVTVSSDVSYGDAGIRNLLDVYQAVPEVRRAAPIFLWLHGGAWVMGHKKQQGIPLLYSLAQRGWLCVSMNYQLGPVSRFPASLIDVKRAIAWIQQHAPTYGGDPSFIIASGGSAGAHLAALAALTPNQPEYQPGFETVDTALAGAVPLYGRFDFIDRSGVVRHKDFLMDFLGTKVMPGLYADDPHSWDLASPIALVGERAPPMLVAHGTHDSLIPVGEAAAFVTALGAISKQPVVAASIVGAQHAWDLFNTPWTRHTVSAVHTFCEYLYDKRQPPA